MRREADCANGRGEEKVASGSRVRITALSRRGGCGLVLAVTRLGRERGTQVHIGEGHVVNQSRGPKREEQGLEG